MTTSITRSAHTMSLLDGEVVDFAFLDAAADELAGEDIDDRVRLERDAAPRGAQVGDVPAPESA